jgi:homopolymeric O-antigen transport system ATP-binding protein
MSLCFERVCCAPLRDISLRFASGMTVGLVGPDDAGTGVLLRLAAGLLTPESGRVEAEAGATLVEAGPGARARLEGLLDTSPRLLLVDHALSLVDSAFQVKFTQAMARWQRNGALILIASHDLPLLERTSDLVIALEDGRVVEQGDPGLVAANYRRRMAARAAGGAAPPLAPASRHGDGRVELRSLEILGAGGAPSGTVRSGEEITVRIGLRFQEAVPNPVVGLQIRSRIGVVVYGTNTELEKAEVGPCAAGQDVQVDFRFRCELCPQEYTLTVASHDPDGAAHDWLEDAVLFAVVDDRYTAGVANLRARVEVR